MPGAWPDSPWGEDHLVFKVHEKIFAFLGDSVLGIKAGPTREVADEWLDREAAEEAPARGLGRPGLTRSAV